MTAYPERLLPYDTIAAAVHGDPTAIQTVLRHYQGYISKLSTCTLYDEYGNSYVAVDADVKDQLESALIASILKFELDADYSESF